MKNFGNKLFEYIKTNFKPIILGTILVIVNFAVIATTIYFRHYGIFSKRALLAYAILFIISALIIFILYQAKRKAWKLEKIFLVCGLILGIFYVFALPIGGPPDEPAHFWRAYQLSEGRVFPETDVDGNSGIYIPSNLRAAISSRYSQSEDGYLLTAEDFTTYASEEYVLDSIPADSYLPFNYLPQIIGIWFGKILHLPLIPMMYLSRLLNVVFCVIVTYFCIKFCPVFKKAILLIALLPMTMHLFASVSADGSIICAGFALITFTLYMQKATRQLQFKDFVLLFFICATLTLSKPVYAPLCLILFWIPKARFSSVFRKFFSIIILGMIIFAILVISRLLYGSGSARFDAGEQISFIISKPIKYAFIFAQSSILAPEQFINSTIGRSLEWFSTHLFAPYIITYFVFFVLLCAERVVKISRSLKIFILCAFSFVVIATFTAMFIVWTEPGSTTIEGVQGRYFIPILLLIPLFCQPSNLKRSSAAIEPVRQSEMVKIVKENYLIIFTTLVNVYTIVAIICTHF